MTAAALALSGVITTPSSCPSTSRPLASTAHISRPAPLLLHTRRSAAAGSRGRAAALRVDAWQLPKKKWWEATSPPNVIHISSVQQMVDAMASAGDRLVIVDVFAPWCAACKALYPKMMKVMEERPDVLLLCINFDENKTLVKGLGVKVLPWVMFYRGKLRKLEEFSVSVKKLGMLSDAIERHTSERCYLPSLEAEDIPVLPEFPTVNPKKGAASSPEPAVPAVPKLEPEPVA